MTLDDVYEELIVIVSEVGAQVDVPIESETYFENLIDSFEGDRDAFLNYVKENIGKWFQSIGARPNWLQEAEWQFHDGKPMVFIGQIDVPQSKGIAHDDSAYFVFVDPSKGVTETIIQVS